MIPYRDDNPTQTFAWVTYLLVLVNIGLFVWSVLEPGLVGAVCKWGAAAADLTGVTPAGPAPCPPGQGPGWQTAFTHMYLHGGWLHLLGNMLYLGVFGNNIEDAVGHTRFFVFYTLCGLAALGAQVLAHPASLVPMVGASGAIAGVLGAYLVLYPLARVSVFIPVVIFLMRFEVPAFFMLLMWFGIQVMSGVLEGQGGGSGGVAWYAHVGGFAAGVLLIFFFPKRKRSRRR